MPRTPLTEVGAPGTVAGVAGALDAEGVEFPTEFVAITVKVYAVPLFSPVMVHEVAGAVAIHEEPPGAAVAV